MESTSQIGWEAAFCGSTTSASSPMPFRLNVVYPVLDGVGRCCWNRSRPFTASPMFKVAERMNTVPTRKSGFDHLRLFWRCLDGFLFCFGIG